MSFIFTIYFLIAACALAALSFMIFKIGDALADCPTTGRAAKAGSLTIVPGFVAIGSGAVLVFAGGVFVALTDIAVEGLMAALGVHVGGYAHVIAAGLGLALLFEAVPVLFLAMKLFGAAYLLWIGISLLRAKVSDAPRALPQACSSRSAGRVSSGKP